MAEEMRINPARAKHLVENLNFVKRKIQEVNKTGRSVRLIAVSKLHPANDILALHGPPSSQSHFGENYLQELSAKADLLPRTIKWHFIGGLQTNKCRPLAESIPNLWCVSSIDSSKKADALDKGRANLLASALRSHVCDGEEKLRIMVQVNTSGEESKSGVEPHEATDLCRHVREQCPHLRLQGLMTIGAIARSQATTPETENEDFVTLREVRDKVAEGLGIPPEELELSMGMSSDFEGAIGQGSSEVRVGSTIFGDRPARADAKIKEDVEEGKS